MKPWSIQKQIIMLTLLPVLFVGFGLAIYFTYSQIEYINSSLQKHGRSIAKQIAPAAEYAVFSGNTNLIKPTLVNVLNDQDVIAITIKDKQNNTIISLKHKKQTPAVSSIWRNLIKTKILSFRVPVISQEVKINDLDEKSRNNINIAGQTEADTIGYVDLDVTTYYSDKQKNIKSQ